MTISPSGTRIAVKGAVMDTYIARRDEGNITYYVSDFESGAFTESRDNAQRFEGPGWAEKVAGLGAVLEQVIP
ncbi:MAG: hypothetical protein KAJ55_13915 [Anaerolineales bacterium]|nr:hypothetical protein [Anaerolineales bacterium]